MPNIHYIGKILFIFAMLKKIFQSQPELHSKTLSQKNKTKQNFFCITAAVIIIAEVC